MMFTFSQKLALDTFFVLFKCLTLTKRADGKYEKKIKRRAGRERLLAKFSSVDRKYCSPNYVENQIELNLNTQIISLVTFASTR